MTTSDEKQDFAAIIKGTYDGSASLKYLIVMPRLVYNKSLHYDFPSGVAYISSVMKLSGRSVFTLNPNYKDKDIALLIAEVIERHNIDVIATGGLSAHYAQVYEIISAAKKIKPDIVTIVGGGMITADPAPAMTALECADFGVIGEGEITVCELAGALEKKSDFDSVRGIVFKRGDEWVITGKRDEIANIDGIPFPDYEGFSFEETLGKSPTGFHGGGIYNDRLCILATGRSCPYSCTFCFHTSGKRYRRRSLESVFSEIEYLRDRFGMTTLYVSDELFAHEKTFLQAFCEKIRALNIRWTVSLRVDMASRELLQLFKDSGCNGVVFGLESADDRVLKSMRKQITVKQIENALSLCREINMSFVGNFIFGDLEETYETAMTTLNWWRTHPEYLVKLQWIVVYPGSFLYDEACRKGLITDRVKYLKDGPRDINVSKLTSEERQEIAYLIDTMRQETPESISNVTLVRSGSGRLAIHGKCVRCGNALSIGHKELFIAITLEYCPSCGNRISVYPYDHVNRDIFNRNLTILAGMGQIAFWPVVTGVDTVLEWSPMACNDKVHFVDLSDSKQGRKLFAKGKGGAFKVIEHPDIIQRNGIETVALTSVQGATPSILQTINTRYPSVKQVCFASDLIFDDFTMENMDCRLK